MADYVVTRKNFVIQFRGPAPLVLNSTNAPWINKILKIGRESSGAALAIQTFAGSFIGSPGGAVTTLYPGLAYRVTAAVFNGTWSFPNCVLVDEIPYGSTPPNNAIPTANAGSNTTIQLPVSQAQLNGSATDPDGTIESYQWAQTTGPNLATWNSKVIASPMTSQLIAGTYTFTLVATDNAGATSVSSTVTLTVLAAAQQGSTTTFDFAASSSAFLYNVLDEAKTGYRKRSAFAETKPITTDHTSVDIYVQTQGTTTIESNIYVFKNGQPFAVADPPNGAGLGIEKEEKVTVSLGSGTKTHSFREGPAAFINGVYYNYPITKLVFSGGTFATIGEPALAQNVLILLGDSILSSVVADNAMLGVVPRLRNMPAFANWRIASTAASAGFCVGRFPTVGSVTQLVDQMDAYVGPATGIVVIYDEDITNDYGFGAGVEEFKRVKAAIWDEIRRRRPNWRIVAQNATHRNEENVNTSGFTLADYDYNYGIQDYIVPSGYTPKYALSEIIDVRTNYVRKTANAHFVIGAANYAPNDNVHPNAFQGDLNLVNFIANEVLNTPPTVGTAVYSAPPIQDAVLYDFDFSESLEDQGPNALVMTNTGVTLDATKQAAYFNGSAILSRNLSTLDTYPRGFKLDFAFQFEGSNDAYFAIGQGPGDIKLGFQNTSGGNARVSAQALDATSTDIIAVSQEVNVVAAMIYGSVTWNRSIMRLQVAGGTAVSVPLNSIKSVNGFQASIGAANGMGANFKGWIRQWKMTATGSGEVITTLPELTSISPNTGAKESIVTITGANFGNTQGSGSVTFNNIAAEITEWATGSITAKVPATVPNGANTVRVSTNAGSSNSLAFTVTAASGVIRKYNFRNSLTNDISGNGLNLVLGSEPTGSAPVVTSEGAVFNGISLVGAVNFRDNYSAGWSAKARVVNQDSPLDAYSTFVRLTSSIELIGQATGGNQQIYKLLQYIDSSDNYALIIMDPVPANVPHELIPSWNGTTLSLSLDGVVRTAPCAGLKVAPAGQLGIYVGVSLRATTLSDLEISI